MDTATLTIGLISIAICAMPFVLMSVSKSNKKKYLFNSLSGIAAQQNCELTQYETSGNIAIGMDKSAGVVFFFRKPTDDSRKGIGQFVNLAEVRECKLIKTSAPPMNKNSGGKSVHQILFDAQSMGGGHRYGNGGDGWIRILEFFPDGKTVKVKTFSPLFGISPTTQQFSWKNDARNEYTIKFD